MQEGGEGAGAPPGVRESGGAFWLRGGAVGQEGGKRVGSLGAVSGSGEHQGANRSFVNDSGVGGGTAACDTRGLGDA